MFVKNNKDIFTNGACILGAFFCQNLCHKFKICLNKNVLKGIYLKLTGVHFTFLNYVVCALFSCVFEMFSYILLLSKFEIILICVGI